MLDARDAVARCQRRNIVDARDAISCISQVTFRYDRQVSRFATTYTQCLCVLDNLSSAVIQVLPNYLTVRNIANSRYKLQEEPKMEDDYMH